jgi:predicted aspartyl protease
MTASFEPEEGLVRVATHIWGPFGDTVACLALDTGATRTILSSAVLVLPGYDPAAAIERVRVTTGSGMEYVASVTVTRIEALGQERTGFPLLCHTLPPSAGVDGLLGLDFLRGWRLTVDFRAGRVAVE